MSRDSLIRRALLPLAPQKRSARHVVAADIETDGLGGDFLLGAMLPDGAGSKVRYFDSAHDMLAHFLTGEYRQNELLLHNADYDLRYILPVLLELTYDKFETKLGVNAQDRLIFVKITRNRNAWYIRDTYALMPVPLAELAPLAGMEKLDIGLKVGQLFDPANQNHRAYLERDVTMLLKAYECYRDDLKSEFQCTPAITAGQTGVKMLRRSMWDQPGKYFLHFRQRDAVENMARKAYYGGITFVRTLERQYDITAIDRNAMYAAVMREGVPVGPGYETDHEDSEGRPAIYECRVYCPASVPFTFVPYRDADTLCYPRGTFQTTLCSNTIALARKVGYQIKVLGGYVWWETQPVHKAFVDKCERLELKYKEHGGGLYMIVKQARVSVYGKHGQHKEIKEWLLTDEDLSKTDWTPYCTHDGEIVENLYWKHTDRRQGHMLVHWAAWITAGARNALAEMVYALGPHNVYYGDTDSLYLNTGAFVEAVETRKIELGQYYGQWKIIGRYDYFQAYSAKLKVARNMQDGSWSATHGGVPAKAVDPARLAKLVTSMDFQYRQLPRAMLTLLEKKKPQGIKKVLTPMETDGRWIVGANGRVDPVTLRM